MLITFVILHIKGVTSLRLNGQITDVGDKFESCVMAHYLIYHILIIFNVLFCMFLDVLTSLYAFVPVVGVCAYVPQIMVLLRLKEPVQHFPFSTWFLWLFAGIVSLAYGAFKLGDLLFCLAAVANVVPIMIVLLLAAYKSHGFAFKINTRVDHDVDDIADQMHDQGYKCEYVQRA